MSLNEYRGFIALNAVYVPLFFRFLQVASVLSCLGGASRVARVNPGTKILLPEGGDERVREAAKYVTMEGLANVELITEVRSQMSELGPMASLGLVSA